MAHEISQFNLASREMLTAGFSPRASTASEIGEVKVTCTMTGRTKVRVIRERDRKRKLWLVTLLSVLVIAAAVWEGWTIWEQVNDVPPTPPLEDRIRVSAPTFQPANVLPAPPPAKHKAGSLIQNEINSLLSGPLPRHPPAELVQEAAARRAEKAAALAKTSPPAATRQSQALTQSTANNSANPAGTAQPVMKKAAAPQAPAAAPTAGTVTGAQATFGTAPNVAPPVPAAKPNSSSATGSNQTVVENNEPTEVNARGTTIIFKAPEDAQP